MSEQSTAGSVPSPGWLFDHATGETRWWDGRAWTDHARPLDPIVRTGSVPTSSSSLTGPRAPSSNGPAVAALALALVALGVIAALAWLVPARDPSLALVVGLVAMALGAAAFVLSVIGLVIAILRPTRKGSAVTALVLSALLIGFFVFRMITAASSVDAAALEEDITAWIQAQSGELAVVVCPENPPTAVGSIFRCAVTTPSSPLQVDVTVQADGTVSWTQAP